MLLGFGGAMAARSGFAPLRWLGKAYTAMAVSYTHLDVYKRQVHGVPAIQPVVASDDFAKRHGSARHRDEARSQRGLSLIHI